jgi:hypothetical protein
MQHAWEMRNIYTVLTEKPERKIRLGDLSIDRRILLRWMLWK